MDCRHKTKGAPSVWEPDAPLVFLLRISAELLIARTSFVLHYQDGKTGKTFHTPKQKSAKKISES
jgi:hypothetical protein